MKYDTNSFLNELPDVGQEPVKKRGNVGGYDSTSFLNELPDVGQEPAAVAAIAPERNAFAYANDSAIDAGNSAAGLVKAGFDFVSPGGAVSNSIDGFIKSGQEKQSDWKKQSRKQLQSDLAGSTGELDKAGKYLKHAALDDPIGTVSEAVGQAGPFKALGLALEAVGFGVPAATKIIMGTAGGLSAGEVRGNILDKIKQLSDKDLQQQNKEYADLRSSGISEQDAKQEIGTKLSQHLPELGIAAVAGALGGKYGMEGIAAGVGRTAKTRLGAGAISLADESAQGGIEQVASNYGVRRIDPRQKLTEDVAMNMVAEGLPGGITGVMAGPGPRDGSSAAPPESDSPSRLLAQSAFSTAEGVDPAVQLQDRSRIVLALSQLDDKELEVATTHLAAGNTELQQLLKQSARSPETLKLQDSVLSAGTEEYVKVADAIRRDAGITVDDTSTTATAPAAAAAAMNEMQTTAVDPAVDPGMNPDMSPGNAGVNPGLNPAPLNSAGFAPEPIAQIQAQLLAVSDGRKSGVVIGMEEAQQLTESGALDGFARADVLDNESGATAVFIGRTNEEVVAAKDRADEVGLQRAAGEFLKYAEPRATSDLPEGASVIQQVDPDHGHIIDEQIVTQATAGNVVRIPGTTIRALSVEQAMSERNQTVAQEQEVLQQPDPNTAFNRQEPTDVPQADQAEQSQPQAQAPAAPVVAPLRQMATQPSTASPRMTQWVDAFNASRQLADDQQVDAGSIKEFTPLPKSHLSKIASSVKQAFGVDVVFVETPKSGMKRKDGTVFNKFNGFVDLRNNTLVMNVDAATPLNTLGHELAHLLQVNHPEIYAQLELVVLSRLSAKKAAEFKSFLSSAMTSEGDQTALENEYRSELVAEAMGEMAQQEAFWADVFGRLDKEQGKTLYDMVMETLAKLANALTKNAFIPGVKDMQKVRRAATDAFIGWAAKEANLQDADNLEPHFPVTLADNDPLLTNTLEINTPERIALRKKIIDGHFAGKTAVTDGSQTMIVLGGGGGVGKTTILKVQQKTGAFPADAEMVKINADDIKMLLPEYKQIVESGDWRAAMTTHAESSLLGKVVQYRALGLTAAEVPDEMKPYMPAQSGGTFNILLDATMSEPKKGLTLIKEAKARGYKVSMLAVVANAKTAIARAVKRGEGSGRFVPMEVLAGAHAGFMSSIGIYSNVVDEFSLYSNDVAHGESAFKLDIKNGNHQHTIHKFQNSAEEVRNRHAGDGKQSQGQGNPSVKPAELGAAPEGNESGGDRGGQADGLVRFSRENILAVVQGNRIAPMAVLDKPTESMTKTGLNYLLPIRMEQSVVEKLLSGKDGLRRKMTVDEIMALKEQISTPVAIFNDPTDKGSVVVMTSALVDGEPVVVAINKTPIDKTYNIDSVDLLGRKTQGASTERAKFSPLKTAYSKDLSGILNWIGRAKITHFDLSLATKAFGMDLSRLTNEMNVQSMKDKAYRVKVAGQPLASPAYDSAPSASTLRQQEKELVRPAETSVAQPKRIGANTLTLRKKTEVAETRFGREYKLALEKEVRVVGMAASISTAEMELILADAESAGLTPRQVKSVIETIKKHKKDYPAKDGWAGLVAAGIAFKKDDDGVLIPDSQEPKYQAVAYGYNIPPGETRAKPKIDPVWMAKVQEKFQEQVEQIYNRAKAGDKNAINIIAHQTWYRNVTEVLRREYGGFGDFLADLLGATSPNTPVDTNWRFSVDLLRRFVRGDFDVEMRKFVAYLDAGGQVSKYPSADKIHQISGKLYGMNSGNAMLAVANVWRSIEPGQAPKARNFALNLIGQSNMATIDVWAARMLRRAANLVRGASLPRIPPPAEVGVTGTWNASKTAVTGAFGFGAEVMRVTAEKLTAKGYNVTPPDLQAIAWFAEKELWGTKGWTTKAGEGGSFEENIEKFPVQRYVAGHSVQVGEASPEAGEVSKAQKRILATLNSDKSVVASRSKQTKGLYGGTVESSFDTEWVAEKGKFDPAAVVSDLAEISKGNNQYDIFVSKVLDPSEENANARPGVEIYFKSNTALEAAMPVLQKFTEQGQDGFTLAVDPRAADGNGEYVGVRLQYVPEISMRWDEDLRKSLMQPGALERVLVEKVELLNDITAAVSKMNGVAYANVQRYDTLVIGKENYDDYINSKSASRDSKAGDKAWFGQPIRDLLERAITRYEGDGRQVNTGGVDDIGAGIQTSFSRTEDAQATARLAEPAGRPSIGRNEGQRGSTVSQAIHYGKQGGLNSLVGAQFGKGIKGAEQARLSQPGTDPRIKRRVYFYLPVQGGIPASESGLGGNVYSADLTNLYDPDNSIKGTGATESERASSFESAVLDAGYRGYMNREQGTAVVMNEDVPVRFLGTSDQFNRVQRLIQRIIPKVTTRTEGSETVRKMDQIIGLNAMKAAKAAAPSFKMEYGEARVATTEKNAANEALGASGSAFQFSRDQTQTPAFKKWFGDSKVVDAAGKPLVVYHKSHDDFTVFDKDKVGKNDHGYAGRGFYFMSMPLSGDTYGNRTMPVYLSLQNPYIRTPENWNTDELNPYSWIANHIEEFGSRKESSVAWTKMMIEKGYDGFIDRADPQGGEIVAFEATQIKSSIGNNGNFDGTNPDIRFSRMQEDMDQQIDFMQQRAEAAGYTDSDEFIDKDYDGFVEAARAWRQEHPENTLFSRNATKMMTVQEALDFAKNVKLPFSLGDALRRLNFADAFMLAKNKDERSKLVKDISDATIKTFADSLIPVQRWIEGLPLPELFKQRLLGDMRRADTLRSAKEKEAKSKFAERMYLAVEKASGKYSTDQIKKLAGQWMTAKYAPKANRILVAKDRAKLKVAQAEMAAASRELALAQQARVAARMPGVSGAQVSVAALRLANAIKRDAEAPGKVADAMRELNERLVDVNGPVGMTGFTRGVAGGFNDASAAQIVKDIEAKIDPQLLADIAAPVYEMLAWKKQLDLDSGKVTQTMVNSWTNHADYVPLTGDPRFDEFSADIFQYGNQMNQDADKEMNGRKDSIADDGIDAAFTAVTKSINFSAFQDFKRSLNTAYESAQRQGSDIGLQRVPVTGIVRNSDDVVIYREATSRGMKAYAFKFDNKEVIEALKKGNHETINAFINLASVPTRLYGRLVTQFAPAFAPINFLRDMWERSEFVRVRKIYDQSGKLINTDKAARFSIMHAINPQLWIASVQVNFESSKGSKLRAELEEFIALGGSSTWGSYLAKSSGSIEADIRSNTGSITRGGNKVVDKVSAWNNTFEMIAPLSIYMALKAQNVSPKDAAAATLDLMNFRKRGTAMPAIRALYVFAQPAATSGYNLAQYLATPKGKKRFAAQVVIGAVLYALLAAAWGDDDDKELGNKLDNLPNYTIERTIPIKMGDMMVKVPVGFGPPQLAWAIAGILNRWNSGRYDATTAVLEAGKAWAKSSTPINPSDMEISKRPLEFMMTTLFPTVARPLLNIFADQTGLGSPLTPQFKDDKKMNYEQARRSTPKLFSDMAESIHEMTGIDLFPDHIKAISDGYMIGPMREIMSYFVDNPSKEMRGEKTRIPLVASLVDNINDRQLLNSVYYRERDAISGVAKEYESRMARGELGDWVTPEKTAQLMAYKQFKSQELMFGKMRNSIRKSGLDAEGMAPQLQALEERADIARRSVLVSFLQNQK